MKASQLLRGSIAAVILVCMATASASAAPRAACSVLSLADVRVIVGAPVGIYKPGSFAPTVRGQNTISNCTYTVQNANGRGARLTLMWGAKLAQTQQFYDKRHKELASIKGDVLVLASVTNATQAGITFDQPASKKLLEAALHKL